MKIYFIHGNIFLIFFRMYVNKLKMTPKSKSALDLHDKAQQVLKLDFFQCMSKETRIIFDCLNINHFFFLIWSFLHSLTVYESIFSSLIGRVEYENKKGRGGAKGFHVFDLLFQFWFAVSCCCCCWKENSWSESLTNVLVVIRQKIVPHRWWDLTKWKNKSSENNWHFGFHRKSSRQIPVKEKTKFFDITLL